MSTSRRAIVLAAGLLAMVVPDVAVNADGTSVTWNDGTPPTFDPAGNPIVIPVTGSGFDAAGNATTPTDIITLTQRRRTKYVATVPNAVLTANEVSLSDHVYIGETVAGRINNSAIACPKPVANITRLARTTVYGAGPLVAGVSVSHREARNGLEVACVEFIAEDSIGTIITQRVAAPVVDRLPTDRFAVEEYLSSIDTTTFAAGWIKVNHRVKVWRGGVVADSATDGWRWEGFSTKWYYKRAARVVCYVSGAAYTSGADNVPLGTSAGRWSANIATAKAAPFATVRQAMDGVLLANNIGETLSICDGLEIRLGGTAAREYVLQGRAAGSLNQVAGALIITRDPEIPFDAVRATWGAGQYLPAIALTGPVGVTRAAVLFKDIWVKRTGTAALGATGGANWDFLFDHTCRYDRNAISTAPASYPGVAMYFQGLDLYDGASPSEGFVTIQAAIMHRGIAMDFAGGNCPQAHILLGSIIKNTNGFLAPTTGVTETGGTLNNVILDGVEFITTAGELTIGALAPNYNLNGVKLRHMIGIAINVGAIDSAFGISRDAATGSTTHVCLRHCTIIGAYTLARVNIFYCDRRPALSEDRTHTLMSMRGCILGEGNIKSDLENQQVPPKFGNWDFLYGLGCYGNWFMYSSGSGDGTINGFKVYSQQFPGLFSYYPAAFHSLTAEIVPPGFIDFRAVTATGTPGNPTYVAGSAGGNYRIGPAGAARGMLPARYACRKFDADGLAVTGNDTLGAWR